MTCVLGGDHAAAGELLDSVVDDPNEWSLVADDRRVDVACVVGIGRLLAGDVDGASTAQRLVESELGEADHVRRALAQVEMVRGDLERAARFIDDHEVAGRMDLVLAAKLALRQGDQGEAIRRAIAEMASSIQPMSTLGMSPVAPTNSARSLPRREMSTMPCWPLG